MIDKTKDFFSCKKEADFGWLTRFLDERKYNAADFEVLSRDKNGCPMVKLGYQSTPTSTIERRGLVWFPNEALVRKARALIESKMEKNQ